MSTRRLSEQDKLEAFSAADRDQNGRIVWDEFRRVGDGGMAKGPSLAGQSSPSPPPHLAIFGRWAALRSLEEPPSHSACPQRRRCRRQAVPNPLILLRLTIRRLTVAMLWRRPGTAAVRATFEFKRDDGDTARRPAPCTASCTLHPAPCTLHPARQ